MISPTGVQAVHPDGEVAVARAAAARGTAMGLSSFASKPIEEVVAANPQTFFQIYWAGTRDAIAARVERARAAGAAGLIVTLDWSFSHSRDWGSPAIPEQLDLKAMARLAPEVAAPAAVVAELGEPARRPTSPCPTWRRRASRADVLRRLRRVDADAAADAGTTSRWLREQWDGPFMVKGVMRVDDARRAVDAGVDRDLGVEPRRQQPRRHAGVDPGAAGDRRGRGRPRSRCCSTAASGAAATSSRRWRSAPGR